jgi:hypothetical protein
MKMPSPMSHITEKRKLELGKCEKSQPVSYRRKGIKVLSQTRSLIKGLPKNHLLPNPTSNAKYLGSSIYLLRE